MKKEPVKLKILYLITKANWGGAQRYVYDLATGVPADSFDVAVIAGEGQELFQALEEKGIRTIRLSNLKRDVKIWGDFQTFFELIEIFKKEKPDIIHSNSSKMGLLASLAGRFYNFYSTILRTSNAKPARTTGAVQSGGRYTLHATRIIFTAHGWAFNENRSLVSKKILLFLHWLTILFSHITIAVSEKTKSDISRLPFLGEKLTVIYNGIESPLFKEKNDARNMLVPKAIGSFWVGTISELHKNKGLDFAIDAFKKFLEDVPNSIFVIIGDGEEKLALEKQILDNNLTGKVFLLGRIPNASEYIKAFDIFTLTSRTEALPYTILEASLAKVPIIASSVGGIPEIITSLKTGILTRPGNVKEIYNGLMHLARNQKQGSVYAENLFKVINKKFSQAEMIKQTMYIYKDNQKKS